MTFQPTIPKSTDLISVSQGDILNNFTAIGTSFDVNHIDFNAAGAGKHKFVEMPNQGSDPAGGATEGTLYTKVATQTELFFRRDAGTVIQMTNGTPTGATIQGTTFIPGGFQIKWGQFTTSGNPFTLNYTALVPALANFPNGTLMVQLTPLNSVGVGNYRVVTNGATGFIVNAPSGSSFYFFAIGF